ncbi:MAG: cation:proton antiporter, partial [Myxococcaceae bacterium]
IPVALLTSTVIVSFSPTVTIAIVQETRAKGPFTEFLMALVILGDLLVMVLFAGSAGWVRASQGASLSVGVLLGGVGWELFGSILVGFLIAIPVLLYLRLVRRDLPLFISAICFVAAEGSAALHLSPLLVALSAGALISNLDEREGERLNHSIQRAGLPVFALFFAAAGAGLHLNALGSVGLLALVLVAVRALAIFLSTRVFARKTEPNLRQFLWMGLISQAGVTFGLAALVRRTFPEFGADVEVLIVAMVTLHELVGPVLSRRAVIGAGEVDVESAAGKS